MKEGQEYTSIYNKFSMDYEKKYIGFIIWKES